MWFYRIYSENRGFSMKKEQRLTEEHENCDCHDMLSKTDVCMPEKCHIIHEDILNLYDMYQEKAEKCDIYQQKYQANEILVKNLDKENKQLKEKAEKLDKIREYDKRLPAPLQTELYIKLEQENKQLKDSIENLKARTVHLNALESQNDNLKQKLEKIEELYEDWDKNGIPDSLGGLMNPIKEILVLTKRRDN